MSNIFIAVWTAKVNSNMAMLIIYIYNNIININISENKIIKYKQNEENIHKLYNW